jgi:hypothetical protein
MVFLKGTLVVILCLQYETGCIFDTSGLSPLIQDAKDGDKAKSSKDLLAVLEAGISPDRETVIQPCANGLTFCGAGCTNLLTDNLNCSKCGMACPGKKFCSNGLCCATELVACNGQCTDISIDLNNCGACNKKCALDEKCVEGNCNKSSGCASGIDDQVFSLGMRGCKGVVKFAQRASLCAANFRVCTASEWVTWRSGQSPSYNYWTNDVLYATGASENCFVDYLPPGQFCTPDKPMHVCTDHYDSLGNQCNWILCGLKKTTPHDFFGGCLGGDTAGTLCCPI